MKAKKTLDQDLLEILKETNNPVFLLNVDLFIEDLNGPAAKTISKIKSRALHKNFADLFQQAQLSLPKNFSLEKTREFTTSIWLDHSSIHWKIHPFLWEKDKKRITVYLLMGKLSETEQEKTKAYLDSIIALMPGHVYWLNREGYYLGCNDIQAKSALLESRYDIVGLTNETLPWHANQPEMIQRLNDINEKVMSTGKEHVLEESLIPPGESSRTFLSRKKPLFNAHGKVIGMVGISFDITEMKALQETLIKTTEEKKQTKSLLDKVVELLPGLVYWMDKQGTLMGCNQYFADALGFAKASHLVNHPLSEFLPKPEVQQIAQINQYVVEHRRPYSIEETLTLPKKGKCIFLSQRVPLLDEHHHIRGILCASLDITERKKLEQELFASKQRSEKSLNEKLEAETAFEEVISLMPAHVYWMDRQHRFIGCNALQATALGLKSSKEIIGKSPFDFLEQHSAQSIVASNERILKTGKPESIEETGYYADPSAAHTMLVQKAPLRDRHGHISGTISVAVEITELKKMRETLAAAKQRAENRFEKILALMPGHIYWKDQNGRYLGCNDLQAKAAGLRNREEFVGKTIEDLPWANHASIIKQSDREILAGRKIEVIEELPLHLENEDRLFLSQKGPLFDEDNKIVGIIGMAVDITERKRIEHTLNEAKEKAESTTEAKSHFIANMSHDLRTPLHALLGMSEMLRVHRYYPEQEEFINNIYQSGKTLLALVEDILNFSKLEADQFELHIQAFDLPELVNGVISTFSLQAKEKGIQLFSRFDPKIPKHLASDPEPLRRVLLNLIINALKFTSSGHVAVQVECDRIENKAAYLRFTVEDTGVGISEENIKQIFNRFYKVDPEPGMNKNNHYKGTGLGLNIAKQMVAALGGELKVESTLGKGSAFHCILPFEILDAPAAHSEVNLQEDISHFNYRLLLVEDDFLAQRVSLSILQELGCTVDVASSGAQALQKMKEKQFDLIFMDIGLPDQDGLSVTKTLREIESLNKNTIIYALTAHASEQDAEVCRNAGMNGFLVKPAMLASFKKALLEVFGKK